jgi:hypothetical protein
MAWTTVMASEGLECSCCRIRQDLSWALARFPGARNRAWAALTAFWLVDRGRYRPKGPAVGILAV